MRVCLWGAGNIGIGAARRLSTSPFVSEIHWVNRSREKLRPLVIDLEHGLPLTPSCRRVVPYAQKDAGRALDRSDVLVVTAGAPVPPGATRADVYETNRDELFAPVLAPAVHDWNGIVLVVSNPVDALARLLHLRSSLPWERVFGLGTVVETARARHAIGSHLSPTRPGREVWAYCVGTHDPDFVLVPPRPVGHDGGLRDDVIAQVREEVAKGADRVKSAGTEGNPAATLHPVVEGILLVVEAIARDAHAVLTVSTLQDGDGSLFYSVPCTIGRGGVLHRHMGVVELPVVRAGLERCRKHQIDLLRSAGELT